MSVGCPIDADLKFILDQLEKDIETLTREKFWTHYRLCIYWLAREPYGLTEGTLDEYLQWGRYHGKSFTLFDEEGNIRYD